MCTWTNPHPTSEYIKVLEKMSWNHQNSRQKNSRFFWKPETKKEVFNANNFIEIIKISDFTKGTPDVAETELQCEEQPL